MGLHRSRGAWRCQQWLQLFVKASSGGSDRDEELAACLTARFWHGPGSTSLCSLDIPKPQVRFLSSTCALSGNCAWQQTLSCFYGYVRVTWQYRTYGRKPSLSLSLCNLWHRRGAALAGPGCGACARPAASAPGSLRGFRSNKQVTEEVHEVKRTTNELPFDKCPRVCAPARRSGTFCYETN